MLKSSKKHFTFLIFLMLLIISLPLLHNNVVNAAEDNDNITASGNINGVHWEIDGEGTMTFTGKGNVPGHFWRYCGPNSDMNPEPGMDNSEYYEPDLPFENPWGDYVDDIKKVVVNEGITVIKGGAFSGCKNLSEVVLPDGLTVINPCAFQYCTSLKTINLPDSVTYVSMCAFAGSGLKNFTISEKMVSIGSSAFAYCKDLETVEFKNTPKEIPVGLFYGCSSLASLNIPDSVEYIADSSFGGCGNLKNIRLGSSFNNLSGRAFVDCNRLKKVEILSKQGYVDFGDQHADDFSSVTEVRYYAKLNNNSGLKYILNKYFNNAMWVPLDDNGNPMITMMSATNATKYMPKLISIASSDTKATVKWTAVSGANYYNVYYKVNNSAWQKLAGNIKGTSYSYIGKPGYTYSFTVKAIKNGQYSAHNTAGLTIKILGKTPLGNAINSNKGVIINWKTVSGANKYYVYRKLSDGTWSYIGSSTTKSYVDQTAIAGKKYYYTVRAGYRKAIGGFYDGTNSLIIIRLVNPYITSIKKNTSSRTIKWNKVAGAKEYYIYRKTKRSSYVCIGKTTSLSQQDVSVKNNVVYYYTVRAKNGMSVSSFNAGVAIR